MAGIKKDIDRVALEMEYRAGILPYRELAKKFGISAARITQIAGEEEWERDLTAKIQAKTEAKLNRAMLNAIVNKPSENQIVEIVAEVQATIVIKQQGRIGRHLGLSQALLAELESQTIDRELYENLAELMVNPDKNGMDKLNELYRKVITTSQRIDSHKKAVETEKALIAMERQAFNIGDAIEAVAESTGGVTVLLDFDAIQKKREALRTITV